MDNKKYLQKFRRCILEYTNAAGSFDISEDGDEEMTQQTPDEQGMGADMGGEMSADMGGEMGSDMGGEMNTDMGGEMGSDMGNGEGVEGFNPEGEEQMGGSEGASIEGMGGDETSNMGEEDEVIDVDDLTKSQETAEKKIDKMNAKFDKLMGAIESLVKQNSKIEKATADAISATEKRMTDELDKRVPTPQQRMSMRSTKSSPYSMTPNDYMNNYAPENYSDADDNNGVDDVQYKITKDDIDRFTDYSSISKELDIENQNLHNILGF